MDQDKSLSLLALVDQASQIQRKLIEAGGEITEDLEAMLPIAEVHLPTKVEQYAFVVQQLRNQAKFFKEKAEYFAQISKSFDVGADSMEERIKEAAIKLGVSEIIGVDHKFTITNTAGSVEITNEELIEPIYKKEVPVSYKIDKKKIGEDLRLGLPVAGAYLKENKSVKITANRKALK